MLNHADGSKLGHITKALQGYRDRLGVNIEMLEGFADRINNAKTRCFLATQRSTAANRLAGNHTRCIFTNQLGIFIHHPAHHLGGGSNIGSGHILAVADVLPHHLHPTPAKAFLFTNRQGGRIHNHTALTAAQRDIRNSAFPGHPGCQGTNGVDGFGRVEADAALVGTTGIVVLNTKALEDTHAAIIHANGDAECIFAHRPAQKLAHGLIELQQVGYTVKLPLCHFKSIGLGRHLDTPVRIWKLDVNTFC